VVACRRVAELGKSSFWFELEVETPQEAFAVVVVNLHTIWSLFPVFLDFLLAEGISASHGFRFLGAFKKGEREIGEMKV
jgi:hypothetical protein